MFVAESTGGVGNFVVPTLIAAAVSQVVAGPLSVAEYQRGKRQGHIERRFTLPLTAILTTDVMTVPPDATVSEFVHLHVLGRRVRIVPVVDAGDRLRCDRVLCVEGLDDSLRSGTQNRFAFEILQVVIHRSMPCVHRRM